MAKQKTWTLINSDICELQEFLDEVIADNGEIVQVIVQHWNCDGEFGISTSHSYLIIYKQGD